MQPRGPIVGLAFVVLAALPALADESSAVPQEEPPVTLGSGFRGRIDEGKLRRVSLSFGEQGLTVKLAGDAPAA